MPMLYVIYKTVQIVLIIIGYFNSNSTYPGFLKKKKNIIYTLQTIY